MSLVMARAKKGLWSTQKKSMHIGSALKNAQMQTVSENGEYYSLML
jgi:hypothetical protein